MNGKNQLLLLLLLIGFSVFTVAQPLYKDRSQPIEKRVQDLLGRMTAEEKFWQLFMIPGDLDHADSTQYKNGLFGFQVRTTGSAVELATKINSIQKYFLEKTRLGIPIIPFEEALHGLVESKDCTVFPQAIALAATWDTTLMVKVARAIAMQTKERGIRQVLSPVINIASDVRWGRTEETYGEDPFLTSAMAVSFVRAFEQNGIITTPKHFIANVGDGGRDSYPIHISERLLEEIYFPPFKACIQKGGSRSIMSAYNSLNGLGCSSNPWLLTEKLKKEWGFNGFVISDANAVGGEIVLLNTAKNYGESGQHAINAGLDVIFQTEYRHNKLFMPSFIDGSIDSNRINDAVTRVLKAKFELGLFENPYVPIANRDTKNDLKQLAKKAAIESIVLLKNENNVLPLPGDVRSIAVIGMDAKEARLGGYSGPGTNKINMLDAISQRAGTNTKISFAPGCGRITETYKVIAEEYLWSKDSAGLSGEYYSNITLSGLPKVSRRDSKLDFHWTLSGPSRAIASDFYSARWTGQLLAPATGTYKIGLEGNDGFRLYINNKMVIDNWQKQTYQTILTDYYFEKGKKYDIRVEFFEPNGNAHIRLIWNYGLKDDWKRKIDEAASVASRSQVAIVVTGIEEGEFRDRAMLSLPGHQEELIKAIAATGKPVIVIIVGGSAVTMNSWISKVKGILDVWYPGEEGGPAIADILFGDSNPAGRLPITFPSHEAQLPLVYNHKPTGRGDDYNNLSGLPLFPFGFGLSYTKFEYSDIEMSKKNIQSPGSTIVSFTIKNIGTKPGDEVAQLYIRDILSSVGRPIMELKGFQRIHLAAGESNRISFEITPEMLSMLNNKMEEIVEPGDFRIMIGSSSRDIRLKETLTVTSTQNPR
ncbi:MAG TPA: glycoside hydrolase family 3 N-terminal domain-containing protein [Chitinophagaceae bacterium]|nr:glycoside hydrolase family 3 N-terminal domain-containing protein [Chitinophagaceae bacterium]